MVGHTQLLKQRFGPGNPLADDVEQISRALERARRLTRQLLAFGPRHPLQPETANLNELLLEMDQIIRAALPAFVELNIQRDPALKPVKLDRGQMEQVILSLVINAVDAMPAGGILNITTRNTIVDETYAREHPAVQPGEYVVLEVSDSGAQMDNETGVRGLEPLLSAKDRKSAVLSLAGIHAAVRQCSGHLWAATELGRGSIYRIFLPQASWPLLCVQPADIVSFKTGTETILLVEPEEMLRNLTARVLGECGYTVIEASEGEEAMEIARQRNEQIHLVLTDGVIPKMSGRELAGRIAAFHPLVRVLLMSGPAVDFVADDGEPEKGHAIIHKPFTPEALSQRIREVLETAEK